MKNKLRLPFSPHPLLRGGNAQTLAAVWLPSRKEEYRAVQSLVELPDGDRLMLHDDRPDAWQEGDTVALMAHGLGGCHGSPYMARIAKRLNAAGVRVFRLDLRGCGAGEKHARGGAHCGSWADVQAAVEKVAIEAPNSPCELIGFSLGGGLALNLAGRAGETRVGNLSGVLAVCPPIDLHEVDRSFSRGAGRVYSRYFARVMWRQIQKRLAEMENPPEVDTSRVPRGIRQLDEQITAPFHGFRDAAHYYDETSACRHLTNIRVPTRIIAASDDPVIPVKSLLRTPRSKQVEIVVTRGGGHMGFLGQSDGDPDSRWLDWRVVEWVTREG